MFRLGDWFDEFVNRSIPNAFTIGMGEHIRDARKAQGLSQEELAKKVYKRRASISEMENGKMVVDSITLTLLARVLDKPLSYFIPPKYRQHIIPEDLTTEEQELLLQFRQITDETQRKIAMSQLRTIAHIDQE